MTYANSVLANESESTPKFSIRFVIISVVPNGLMPHKRAAVHAELQKLVPYMAHTMTAFFEMNFNIFSKHHMQHFTPHIIAMVI